MAAAPDLTPHDTPWGYGLGTCPWIVDEMAPHINAGPEEDMEDWGRMRLGYSIPSVEELRKNCGGSHRLQMGRWI